MGWRYRIAVVLLAVLAGLPLSGTVCAMLCNSAARKAPFHHHDSGKNCEEAAAPSTGLQLRSVSEHDCSSHDAALQQLITTTAQRGDALAIATPLAAAIVQFTLGTSSSADSAFGYLSPPGTAPPTTTPLVLRV